MMEHRGCKDFVNKMGHLCEHPQAVAREGFQHQVVSLQKMPVASGA